MENPVEVIAPIPPMTQALTELTEVYGKEEWWLGATVADDDFGRRIDIQVDEEKFTSDKDTILRDYKGFGVVVTRRYKSTIVKN